MSSNIGVLPTARPKILLVEDDPGVRRSLQLLLHGKGYDIRSYASSAALLADPLADEAICLVADYRMPGMDGIEVLRFLRARGWQQPAILITAYISPELVERATKDGFSIVIDKPLREHALVDAVARITANPAAFSTAPS
ncbi:response regulator transcription factor [Rhizorhapis sp. SPR117]|uniref:response regulator transcription factor n=1 Tax=Rhizorhapis sp. SPR117 TaxID=2912611 RepID=UPI001F00A4CE|nr:response regulator [Rhizorhapis sp. SPR117]